MERIINSGHMACCYIPTIMVADLKLEIERFKDDGEAFRKVRVGWFAMDAELLRMEEQGIDESHKKLENELRASCYGGGVSVKLNLRLKRHQLRKENLEHKRRGYEISEEVEQLDVKIHEQREELLDFICETNMARKEKRPMDVRLRLNFYLKDRSKIAVDILQQQRAQLRAELDGFREKHVAVDKKIEEFDERLEQLTEHYSSVLTDMRHEKIVTGLPMVDIEGSSYDGEA